MNEQKRQGVVDSHYEVIPTVRHGADETIKCNIRRLSAADRESIMNSPAVRTWLKNCYQRAMNLDPVDAANDAELLYAMLASRCDEILREPVRPIDTNTLGNALKRRA